MMAVILAGGKGTRLKPFTMTIPKPLLPLGDMPILEIVIHQLAAAGVNRIVLTLGHMAPIFTSFLGNGERLGVKIDYCYEETPLGTAGPLRLIEDLEENFLVMNGDVFTTLDYRALIAFHEENRAWGTIAASHREQKIDFGVVVIGQDEQLVEYIEKPSIPYEVSMGVNILSRQCLEFIPPQQKFDMPELMQTMKQAGQRVQCFRTTCYWQDIGRFDDYQQASADFVADPERFIPGWKGA